MKTAISIPDDIFESADELAERMRLSRSRLYSIAVAEFVAKHRHHDTTAKLDEVYAEEPSGLDPDVRAAQRRSLGAGEW